MVKIRELICDIHQSTINKLENIEEYAQKAMRILRYVKCDMEDEGLEGEVDEAINEIENIIYDSPDCIDDIKKAKDMGQKMEDRLSEYHDAIENLGFKRDRKG